MDRLIEGYRRFRADVWPAQHSRYATLAREGQSPDTLVIACSNFRADPHAVFDAGPGELFVVRNVAGLVPPYQPDAHYHGTSAALEFAVRVLKVSRIVVMSHGQCGGVKAMVEGAPAEAREFVKPWMDMAEPILRSMPPDLKDGDILSHCETEVMRLSLANLLTFPWIQQSVADGRLKTQGFRFDIRSGILSRLEGDRLVPVE